MLIYLAGKMLLWDSGDLTDLATLVIRLNHRVSRERPSNTPERRRDTASPLSSSTKRHRHAIRESWKISELFDFASVSSISVILGKKKMAKGKRNKNIFQSGHSMFINYAFGHCYMKIFNSP